MFHFEEQFNGDLSSEFGILNPYTEHRLLYSHLSKASKPLLKTAHAVKNQIYSFQSTVQNAVNIKRYEEQSFSHQLS